MDWILVLWVVLSNGDGGETDRLQIPVENQAQCHQLAHRFMSIGNRLDNENSYIAGCVTRQELDAIIQQSTGGGDG